MNLRILAAAAALACTLGASAQTVTTVDLGPLTDDATPVGAFKAPGFYLDLYQFAVGASGLAAGAVVSTPIDLPFTPGLEYGYSFVGIGLFNDAFAPLLLDQDGSDGFSLQVGLPTAGTYYFGVLGQTTGSLGGAYGGVLQTVVAAVPEPETYAMLLAGLGAMGLVSRRRRQR